MTKTPPTIEELHCGCGHDDPWPPPSIGPAPEPTPANPPPAATVPPQRYDLRGPQVEPAASFWTLCRVPCVIRIEELVKRTDQPDDPCYFPPYPTDSSVVRDELDELVELASMRDDPEAVAGNRPRRERRGISPLLQLRPQPITAVVNVEHDPVLGPVHAGRQPEHHAIEIDRGRITDARFPVIRTGRELARYFEEETPGLAHRLALTQLLSQQMWSPPRQALAWAALDITSYSALLAAWYYKWAAHIGGPGVPARAGVSFRPRPIEADYRMSVLYNRMVNDAGSGDADRRRLPDPSPGTPRHPAYPSGHSTYAGAASEILSYFFPDYTEELDRLADNAGMARLWGGIHWRSDHVEGMKLGRCVARMVIEQLEASCICSDDPCRMPDFCAPPPGDEELKTCRDEVVACCEETHPYGQGSQEAGDQAEEAHRDDA